MDSYSNFLLHFHFKVLLSGLTAACPGWLSLFHLVRNFIFVCFYLYFGSYLTSWLLAKHNPLEMEYNEATLSSTLIQAYFKVNLQLSTFVGQLITKNPNLDQQF